MVIEKIERGNHKWEMPLLLIMGYTLETIVF